MASVSCVVRLLVHAGGRCDPNRNPFTPKTTATTTKQRCFQPETRHSCAQTPAISAALASECAPPITGSFSSFHLCVEPAAPSKVTSVTAFAGPVYVCFLPARVPRSNARPLGGGFLSNHANQAPTFRQRNTHCHDAANAAAAAAAAAAAGLSPTPNHESNNALATHLSGCLQNGPAQAGARVRRRQRPRFVWSKGKGVAACDRKGRG